MLEVTETATKQLEEFFKDKEIPGIRIFMNEGGWGGPSLAMALDEPSENDDIFNIDNFKYIINKDFMEKAKPLKVDYSTLGFKISSSMDLGGGGCGGGCGSTSDSSCC